MELNPDAESSSDEEEPAPMEEEVSLLQFEMLKSKFWLDVVSQLTVSRLVSPEHILSWHQVTECNWKLSEQEEWRGKA